MSLNEALHLYHDLHESYKKYLNRGFKTKVLIKRPCNDYFHKNRLTFDRNQVNHLVTDATLVYRSVIDTGQVYLC